ncbi:MAG: MFS transporter [Acidaminococcaceae bacterium]
MENEWRKKLAVLWLAQFVGMCAITGLISFLPLYVSHLGITDTSEAAMWAGVLIGAASFCAAVSNPFWGALADRKGRKPMVEKVLFMFGIIMIAMAFATNVYQLFILRMLQGLCGGFVAAATALAVSLSPKEQIAFTIGIFQTSLIVGGAVGPMIGGLIADHFGYRQPFFMFGLLCFLSLILIRFSIVETFVPVGKSERTSVREVFAYIWSMADLRIMLLIQCLTQFAIQSIGPILPLYIRTMVVDDSNLASISGTIIAIGGIASAFASGSMGFLINRYSHKQIMLVASLLGSISFLGQMAASDIITLGTMRFLNGLCIGAMIPSSNTIITYLIPETKRGAAFGITSTFALMGNVLGPISAGFLTLAYGFQSIFWVTGIFFLLIAFLLLTRIKDHYAAIEEEKNMAV